MTTPAHCARTDPHATHNVFEGTGGVNCPGVEPPADVQATSDPRLDVVAKFIRESWVGEDDNVDFKGAQRILDALDAMRPAGVADEVAGFWQLEDPPAGLSAAQEIRLRVLEVSGTATRDADAAWVEHGPDETPSLEAQAGLLRLAEQRNAAVIRANEAEAEVVRLLGLLEAAVARADLAESRLGHIADAVVCLESSTDPLGDWPAFADTVREYLTWTPDDTIGGMPVVRTPADVQKLGYVWTPDVGTESSDD